MINIRKNGIITNVGPDQEWLDRHIAMGTFGSEASSYQRESVPAVFDEEGNEISPAEYETIQVPASYEIEFY